MAGPDERLRELERRWREDGDEDAGWAVVFERMRSEGVMTRLLKTLVRLETVLRAGVSAVEGRSRLRGPAEVTAEEVLAWLDQERPPPVVRGPVMPPVELAPPGVRATPANRGYSPEWLNTMCGRCAHQRGHHERPPEERGHCLLLGCTCPLFLLPP